ncbi:MAG: hypothetical protein ACOC1U_03860 [Spirochaetota bacterium]
MRTTVTSRVSRPMLRTLVPMMFAVLASTAFAQSLPSGIDPGDAVSLRTQSGESFQGTLYAVLDDRVEIVVSDGRIIQIAISRIEAAARIDPVSGDRGFFEDSAANRLVVMPTGFPMDAGEFHVASQEIVAVTGSYGINSWLSVWGGISIPGALSSLRASFLVGDVGVSAGAFVGASWLDLSLGPFVLPYALVSYGDPANNVTVGSGFGMTFNEGFSIPAAVVAVGGKRALSATTALVTENWVVWGERSSFIGPEGPAISAVPTIAAPSLVFRIASSRLSWDIGGVVPLFIDGAPDGSYRLATPVIPIPVLSITYRIQ